MAGSVFGKIAERVYAKDLRLDLRQAIDTTATLMPDVKAGNVADARRVLKELKVDGVARLTLTVARKEETRRA